MKFIFPKNGKCQFRSGCRTASHLLVLLLAWVGVLQAKDLVLVSPQDAPASVVVDPGAPSYERFALQELTNFLHQISGAVFPVRSGEKEEDQTGRVIFVGDSPAARHAFPNYDWNHLPAEQVMIQTGDGKLLLAGGRPRGTIYAVERFLQDQLGVRFWTPWASHIPKQGRLTVSNLSIEGLPAFEYREPFWYPAFDALWAVRSGYNGQSSQVPEEQGGRIKYKGFVHTFYPLVPPETHFAKHPEWFSLVKGQRSTNRAQLCLTNPGLREELLKQVRNWLKESPEAGILSVSQNDWYGGCECRDCKALDEREGGAAGSMLDCVNWIADRIAPDFPNVAIDTLAYQYTRKPTRTIHPRPNVIVRLCSIECNFREPLTHASNRSFARDIEGWAKVCNRLYIWDYTTDFGHYVQPHPNWFVLGENLRFFRDHHVLGVFEQGAYQSHGSEMAELRAWVLARLLWDPDLNESALIDEFLNGYYGAEAAPYLRRYLEVLHQASRGHVIGCFASVTSKWIQFAPLADAERLLQAAEASVAHKPELLERVRLAHLPVRYVFLARWDDFKSEQVRSKSEWPLSSDFEAVAGEFETVAKGVSGKPWTEVRLMSESGTTPAKFLERQRAKRSVEK